LFRDETAAAERPFSSPGAHPREAAIAKLELRRKVQKAYRNEPIMPRNPPFERKSRQNQKMHDFDATPAQALRFANQSDSDSNAAGIDREKLPRLTFLL
jgi:hypothetical protein